jgi:hypothetical protein
MRETNVGIPAVDCKHDVHYDNPNGFRGQRVGFLTEFFWALFMVGVPIGCFTLALVWWALKGGHFKEALDIDALEHEIKVMGWSDKKRTKKGIDQASGTQHPLQKKWARFGGGFYGIVAFFTYIIVEVLDVVSVISNFGGFFDFLKQLNLNVIIDLIVQAITNFVMAMAWPWYWLNRIDTDFVWIWFVMAYAGYWAGLRLARLLIKRSSQVVT